MSAQCTGGPVVGVQRGVVRQKPAESENEISGTWKKHSFGTARVAKKQ